MPSRTCSVPARRQSLKGEAAAPPALGDYRRGSYRVSVRRVPPRCWTEATPPRITSRRRTETASNAGSGALRSPVEHMSMSRRQLLYARCSGIKAERSTCCATSSIERQSATSRDRASLAASALRGERWTFGRRPARPASRRG